MIYSRLNDWFLECLYFCRTMVIESIVIKSMVINMSSSPDILKGFVRSLLGHSLSRAVLVSVADTCRLVNRNNHERFYKGKFENVHSTVIPLSWITFRKLIFPEYWIGFSLAFYLHMVDIFIVQSVWFEHAPCQGVIRFELMKILFKRKLKIKSSIYNF